MEIRKTQDKFELTELDQYLNGSNVLCIQELPKTNSLLVGIKGNPNLMVLSLNNGEVL